MPLSMRAHKRNGPEKGPSRLFAKTQLRDKFRVAARVFLFQIVKQAAALVDEHQKATTAVVILVMTFELLGQVRDALGQDRHLHLGRPRIAILAGMFLDEFLLALRGNRQDRKRTRLHSTPQWATCM